MLKVLGRPIALLFAIAALVVAVSPNRSQAKCNIVCVMKFANKDCIAGKCIYWDTDTCYGCDAANAGFCDDATYDKMKPVCGPDPGKKINGTYYPICTETCSCVGESWVEANMFNGSPTDGPTFDRKICQ